MNLHAQRLFEMLVRVHDFHMTHADRIPPGSFAARVFADVDAALARIAERSERQISVHGSVRELTVSKAVCRHALRKRMKAVAVTSRGVVLNKVGLAAPFELPGALADLDLVIEARARADAAEPFAASFIERGMPEDFIERLRAEADALDRAKDAKSHAIHTGSGLVAGLDEAIKYGFTAVRQLDGILLNLFADDEPTLAAWKAARRVDWWQRRRTPQRAKG